MRSPRFIALVAWAAGFALAAAPSAQAAPSKPGGGCSVKTLHGVYAFLGSGSISLDGDANWAPKAVVQQTTFDGQGGFVTTWGRVANRLGDGQIFDIPPSTGTYTVAADCTGEMQVDQGPTFDFVTGPLGHSARFVQVNPWNVLQGTMQRMGR